MHNRTLSGSLAVSLFASALFACSATTTAPSTSNPPASNSPGDEEPSAAGDAPSAADESPTAPSEQPKPKPKPSVQTSGTATYKSNLADFSIVVADIRVKHETPRLKSDGTYESELNFTLTDRPGACADYTNHVAHRGTRKVKIEIEARGATVQEAQIVPGTYVIDESNDVLDVERFELDDQCYVSNEKALPFSFSAATVKTVTITSISATHVKGSYEVRASDGKYIEGVFDADICPIVATSTAPACVD